MSPIDVFRVVGWYKGKLFNDSYLKFLLQATSRKEKVFSLMGDFNVNLRSNDRMTDDSLMTGKLFEPRIFASWEGNGKNYDNHIERYKSDLRNTFKLSHSLVC